MEAIDIYEEESRKLAEHAAQCKTTGKEVCALCGGDVLCLSVCGCVDACVCIEAYMHVRMCKCVRVVGLLQSLRGFSG